MHMCLTYSTTIGIVSSNRLYIFHCSFLLLLITGWTQQTYLNHLCSFCSTKMLIGSTHLDTTPILIHPSVFIFNYITIQLKFKIFWDLFLIINLFITTNFSLFYLNLYYNTWLGTIFLLLFITFNFILRYHSETTEE